MRRFSPETAPWELPIAVRSLLSRPAYLTVAALTLGLGIAAAVVVFSVIDAVALRALPYDDAERLVGIWERSLEDPEIDRWPVSPANYLDWRSMAGSFTDLAAYDYGSPTFADEASAERLRGLLVTGNLFELLGAEPMLGRAIGGDDVEDGAPVAVISEGLWTRAFGRAEEAVGRTVELDGTPTTIVGVMPAAFRFPFDQRIDVWRPLQLGAEVAADRSTPTLFVVGRLRPGVTLASARREVAALGRSLAERHPATNGQRGINLVTLRENFLEWRLPALRIFALAAAVALAIACMNLAGLMLSRGISRVDELAVRSALGAGRGRIAWLLVAEGMLVALAGAATGAVLSWTALPLLIGAAPENWAGPLLSSAAVDARALAVSVLVGLGTAGVASLVPALRVPRRDLERVLHGGGRAAGSLSQLRLRRGLVVVQTTLAVALLAQAGLLGRSLYNVFAYDVGFDSDDVLTARVRVDPETSEPLGFFDRLVGEAGAIPGVEGVTLANIAPLSGGGLPVTVTTDGSAPSNTLDAEAYNRETQYRVVGDRFFELLEIPLVRGRGFDDGDVAGSERVAIVNEAFVREFVGDRDPADLPVRMVPAFSRPSEGFDDPVRIVGVVGDVAEWGIWMQPPIVYVPYRQHAAAPSMTLLLRTAVAPESLIEPLRETVWQLGSRQPVERISTLEQYEAGLYAMHDFMIVMLGAFAATALLLAATGLYGVVSLQVGLRTRELSVRRAIGARARDVLWAVLREGAVLSVAGATLACLIVVAAGRWVAASWIGNFLHEVGWLDPLSLGISAALMVATALLSCLVPARRAARVDPALALKSE